MGPLSLKTRCKKFQMTNTLAYYAKVSVKGKKKTSRICAYKVFFIPDVSSVFTMSIRCQKMLTQRLMGKEGATTLSITTFSIMTLSIMTFSIRTLSKTPLSIMTVSIMTSSLLILSI
jgi:hypothetical protein